jgi:hypothetical protein
VEANLETDVLTACELILKDHLVMKRFRNDHYTATFNYFLAMAYTFYLNLLENNERKKNTEEANQF